MIRRAARAFTLVELMVYLALVTGGLVVVGGLALSAQRTVALQQALIDVNVEASRYLSRLRRDVEASRELDVSQDRLVVTRLDGMLVVYGLRTRVEIDEKGVERGRDVFPSLTSAAFAREGVAVVATLEATVRFGWRDAVHKRYRRVATPLRERERTP